jgi:hypothetical protein
MNFRSAIFRPGGSPPPGLRFENKSRAGAEFRAARCPSPPSQRRNKVLLSPNVDQYPLGSVSTIKFFFENTFEGGLDRYFQICFWLYLQGERRFRKIISCFAGGPEGFHHGIFSKSQTHKDRHSFWLFLVLKQLVSGHRRMGYYPTEQDYLDLGMFFWK